MKRAELIFGSLAVIAIILSLLLVPGGSVLIILSLTSLSVIYMYFSFAFFNEIQLKSVFKKESYAGTSTMRILGAILLGLALSLTIIGIVFKFLSWPGAHMQLIIGCFGLTIGLIVGVIRYQKTKSSYYTKIFKRIAIYGGFALLLILIPKSTWIDIKYRNAPEYAKALKDALNDPENEELLEKVREEREKIFRIE